MTAEELAEKLADFSRFTFGELGQIADTFGVTPASLHMAIGGDE